MRLPRAPRGLSERSKRIWKDVLEEWALDKSLLVLLRVALEALDRREEARKVIKKDGIVVVSPSGMQRAHPALKIERESTSAFLSKRRAIGFNLDPPQEQGRPTGGRK